jgi:hypothetical protein
MKQLDSLHVNNPKLYWNLINDLRQQKEKDQRGSVVDPPSWVSHFEKLNQVKDEFKERLKNLEIQLDMLEKQTTFNELDMNISKAEISKAISIELKSFPSALVTEIPL